MRRGPQPRSGVGPEKPKPGSDGITRSNAIAGSSPCTRGSVRGPITSRYSTNVPGQPWLSTSGSAFGSGDRTCRKCTVVPSIVVVNWSYALIWASQRRQS
ncbi:hypothetical protein JOD67_005799 [Tenggerimyces flavus]|nr:hypothetical protein [Tenggerimyces flavus]